jgi:hypothetical protein
VSMQDRTTVAGQARASLVRQVETARTRSDPHLTESRSRVIVEVRQPSSRCY